VEKHLIRDAWLAQIESDLDAVTKSQMASHTSATHEESRSEHAKDTRALESSYLARGLAERVVEMRQVLIAARNMDLKTFDAGTPIVVSALFTLEEHPSGTCTQYFLTSVAGGIRLSFQELEILTLTPVAPLGAAVKGRYLDEEVSLKTPQGFRKFLIRELC
jgi:hypothetical protein